MRIPARAAEVRPANGRAESSNAPAIKQLETTIGPCAFRLLWLHTSRVWTSCPGRGAWLVEVGDRSWRYRGSGTDPVSNFGADWSLSNSQDSGLVEARPGLWRALGKNTDSRFLGPNVLQAPRRKTSASGSRNQSGSAPGIRRNPVVFQSTELRLTTGSRRRRFDITSLPSIQPCPVPSPSMPDIG